ncbi:hypothetical protein JCM19037_4269 [Geomicrobium sp. JCM 19037]|uniref:hypothetical protein n=1 Tax=Geomicrobium sp. JCM 19037 TaxID=1460634 RepID=UPI00045F2067|nr:hypothetical protein [Geomicrobium sp. JCM 19037]GAK05742.1 hypothetical protein JCM19037_4269 [Geomicrobium sp. JCM 19037]
MIQISKRRFWLFIGLVMMLGLYAGSLQQTNNEQQNYLSLQVNMYQNQMQNEVYLLAGILQTVTEEGEIPRSQWEQIVRALETIKENSHELERMAIEFHANASSPLSQTTTATADFMLQELQEIEHREVDDNLEREERIEFSDRALVELDLIHETATAWYEEIGGYLSYSQSVGRTYWVEMMERMHEPSVQYQQERFS